MIGVAVASKINTQAGTTQTNTNAQTAPPPLSPPRTHKHNSPSSLLPLPCFLFTILPLCALCCSCPMWRQDEQHAPSTKHQPELDLHSENAGKLLNPGRIPYTSEHGPHGAPSTTSKINITFCEADISEGSNTFTLLSCF